MSKGLLITIIVAVAVLAGAFGMYGYMNNLRNTGITYEEAISASYENNQNVLSAINLKIKETLGVANVKSEKLDEILTHAVQGRYGDEGFSSDGAFFAAVVEGYPDLAGLDIYDRVADAVSAGREEFKNHQARLRDQVRVFDTWRRQGFVRSIVVAKMFPSNALEARIGGQVVASGEAALDRMRAMILEGSATQAYQTGQMDALIQ